MPTTPVQIGDEVRVTPPARGAQDVWHGTVEQLSPTTGMVRVQTAGGPRAWSEWVPLDRITVIP